MLEPKIDILILGVGERENLSKIDSNVIKHLRKNKINVEILATDQALATFNFLNAEKRYIAGAFIPPSYMDMNEDESSSVNMVLPGSDGEREGQDDDDIKYLFDEAEKRRQERAKEKEHKPGGEY